MLALTLFRMSNDRQNVATLYRSRGDEDKSILFQNNVISVVKTKDLVTS